MAITLFVAEDSPGSLAHQASQLSELSQSGQLGVEPEIEIVGVAASGAAALGEIARTRPQIVLQDLELPRLGIEMTRAVKARWPRIEVLVASAFDAEHKLMEAIQAGAEGYLLKTDKPSLFLEAVRALSQGGSMVQPKLARGLLRYFRKRSDLAERPSEGALRESAPAAALELPTPFSEREIEMLRAVAQGNNTREVAELFHISPATVHGHLQHIYEKLGVHTRVLAITEGIRRGLIQLEASRGGAGVGESA